MIISRTCAIFLLSLLAADCALLDDSAPKKPEAAGLIATPATYYSTAKARYLGARYKNNLDRLIERVTRNPKTASLQFANNISSVGGIGFFTHSATKTPDERYLELVLATPETFEVKGEFSDKLARLFSRYGAELLGIVSADNEIFQDRELSGYGLNFAWRNVVTEPAGNRVMLERGIIYFSKEKARNFLRQEINQNGLLADAVIFAVEEDGPLNLVSYRPAETQPDVRPAIREDNLAAIPTAPKSVESVAAPAKGEQIRLPVRLPEAKPETRQPQNLAQAEIPKAPPLPSVAEIDTPPVTVVKPSPPAVAPLAQQKTVDSLAGEQLAALKNKSIEVAPAKPAAVRAAPKALEGFIIQLAFSDKNKAQRWAESMEKRGFAVSLTEAGTEGALRVRLGNFPAREEAERQLRTFKQDGLSGIVISLPQTFRPEARTSIP